MRGSAASFLGVLGARVIRQNHAHDFGREGVKVSAIGPVSFFLRDQTQAHFIDQGGRLEFSGIPLSLYVGCGHFAQVGVDEWHQLLEGRRLTVSQLCQEQSDLSLGWLHNRLHPYGNFETRVAAAYPTIFQSTPVSHFGSTNLHLYWGFKLGGGSPHPLASKTWFATHAARATAFVGFSPVSIKLTVWTEVASCLIMRNRFSFSVRHSATFLRCLL
jgi:hypothetical protein